MNKSSVFIFLLLVLFCAAPVLPQSGAQPTRYGILLDNTGSLRFQMDNIKNTAKEILSRTNQQDSVSVFNFETDRTPESRGARIITAVDATLDKNAAGKYIDTVVTVGGQTTLFDAIFSAAEKINSASDAAKVLFLLTDGEDRNSKIQQAELIAFLQQNRIKVYAVGLTRDLNSEMGFIGRDSIKTRSEKFLKKITAETGGKAVFPKEKDNAKKTIDNLFTEKKQ